MGAGWAGGAHSPGLAVGLGPASESMSPGRCPNEDVNSGTPGWPSQGHSLTCTCVLGASPAWDPSPTDVGGLSGPRWETRGSAPASLGSWTPGLGSNQAGSEGQRGRLPTVSAAPGWGWLSWGGGGVRVVTSPVPQHPLPPPGRMGAALPGPASLPFHPQEASLCQTHPLRLPCRHPEGGAAVLWC